MESIKTAEKIQGNDILYEIIFPAQNKEKLLDSWIRSKKSSPWERREAFCLSSTINLPNLLKLIYTQQMFDKSKHASCAVILSWLFYSICVNYAKREGKFSHQNAIIKLYAYTFWLIRLIFSPFSLFDLPCNWSLPPFSGAALSCYIILHQILYLRSRVSHHCLCWRTDYKMGQTGEKKKKEQAGLFSINAPTATQWGEPFITF